ncbi:MAG: lipid IV(A) 3-deoxy-D-manno-octulosonic acid transferase [Gammaproteobacteria bacterium]
MTAETPHRSTIVATLLRYLYQIVLYLAAPFIVFRLWYRARQSPGYGHRWWQRFGFAPLLTHPAVIWIHAASVGEVAAATPLVQALKQHYPDHQLLFTTTTATGAQRLKQLLADQVQHCYVPYDFPDAIKRFLQQVHPQMLIIMETELWPNLLHYAHRQHIPILLANARLSERSASGYRWFASLMRQMLQNITLIAAQTGADAARFLKLGANPAHIAVWGNLKFETRLPYDLMQRSLTLRKSFGAERPIWIAASTHPGEDELVLQAHKQIQQVLPNCLLILVPRHPERFDEVAQLCQQQGFRLARRSIANADAASSDVFLGDTLGELLLFYAASDVAFVAGSLIPQGGHNLLEPAAVGIPIVTGPHVFNFAAIAQLLFENNAAIQINDPTQLTQIVLQLLNNKTQREQLIQHAQQIIQQNQGVLQRYLDWVKQYL